MGSFKKKEKLGLQRSDHENEVDSMAEETYAAVSEKNETEGLVCVGQYVPSEQNKA